MQIIEEALRLGAADLSEMQMELDHVGDNTGKKQPKVHSKSSQTSIPNRLKNVLGAGLGVLAGNCKRKSSQTKNLFILS